MRIKRDTGSETELLGTNGDTESAIIEKRDANPEPSRLDHISVLPPPHDLPPRPDLPLFPPLGSPPPHHHSPTPVPASGRHVTIPTPTHHVSHGVADHGTVFTMLYIKSIIKFMATQAIITIWCIMNLLVQEAMLLHLVIFLLNTTAFHLSMFM